MKKIILTIALCVTTIVSMAQTKTINIVIPGAAGGLLDWPVRELEHVIKNAGYTTETQMVNSCQGAVSWLKNNPDKPAVMASSVMLAQSDSGCNLEYNKNNFLGIAVASYMAICSMLPPDQALNKFLQDRSKIGVTLNAPDQFKELQDIIDTMHLNSKIIYYQGGPKIEQALISGDVDFVLSSFTTEAIISAGGNCFLTTGNKKYADQVGQTSLATISPDSKWIDSYFLLNYLGFNIDVNLMRKFVEVAKQGEVMQNKQRKLGYPPGGMFAGKNIDQQWDQHKKYIELFK